MLATAGSALRAIRVLQVSNQLLLLDVSFTLHSYSTATNS